MSDWGRTVKDATALVRRRAGLTQAGGRDVAVALKRVMTAEHRADPAAYLRLLETDPGTFDALIGELTVGETFFLRETGQLDFLRREVIPELARGRSGTIRAWSAGCASGEEVYTLSMLFHEAGLSDRTHVLGTDIARDRLRRARKGQYRPWSFRGVPEIVQRRYFRMNGGALEVGPELRDSVDFHYLNLLDEDYRHAGVIPGGMDLILCRNVLIYLDPESVAHVGLRLSQALRPDGWLLLAAADPRLHDLAEWEVLTTGFGVIYRKGSRSSRAQDGARAPVEPEFRGRVLTILGSRIGPAERTIGPAAAAPASAAAAASASESTESAEAIVHAIERVRRLADEGNLARAGVECAAAMERHPHNAELAYLESVLLFEAGNHAAAAAAGRRALYLNPHLAVAHLALGNAYARMGQTDAARRAFGTADRLLATMPPVSPVPAAGGATAATMVELARVQLRLLQEKSS